MTDEWMLIPFIRHIRDKVDEMDGGWHPSVIHLILTNHRMTDEGGQLLPRSHRARRDESSAARAMGKVCPPHTAPRGPSWPRICVRRLAYMQASPRL